MLSLRPAHKPQPSIRDVDVIVGFPGRWYPAGVVGGFHLVHRSRRRNDRGLAILFATPLVLTPGLGLSQHISTAPATIPIDPAHIITEDPSDDRPHGFIEREEGVYLYEILTGRVLALLPPLDAAAMLSGVSGQSLDRLASPPPLPPTLSPFESWPQLLPDAPAGPPAVGDVTGDGQPEVVLTLVNGEVLVFDSQGLVLPGWPRLLEGSIHHGATIADVNHDGRDEILFATAVGNAHALTGIGGEELAGWPVCMESLTPGEQVWAPPVVADLDGVGDLEVILIGTDGTLEILGVGGRSVAGWPVRYPAADVPSNPAASFAIPRVADLEGDGELEIITALNSGVVTATDADGERALGWPRILPNRSRAGFGAVAIADLDGQGGLNVVVATDRGFPGPPNLVAFRHDGTVLEGWPVELSQPANGGVALADLDGDGSLEVIVATIGGEAELIVIRADGTVMPGWPRRFPSISFESGVVVGDVDGQPGPEILALGTVAEYDSRVQLHAFTRNGKTLEGFPVEFETADAFEGGLTLSDLDLDGHQEVLLAIGGVPRIAIFRSAGTEVQATPWPRSGRGREQIARTPRIEREAGPRLPPDRDPEPELALPAHDLPPSLDPNTTISFVLNRTTDVRLRVLDIQGAAVQTALAGRFPKGLYAIEWDGLDASGEEMPTGVYFFELAVDGVVRTKRLVSLLR